MICQRNESLYKKDLKSLIEYQREENGDRITTIIKGVISNTQFYKLERGDYIDDKMVVDRILKRMGIDPGEVEMVILQKDAQRCILREKIYNAYNKQRYDEVEELLEEYKKQIVRQHRVHHQFVGKISALIMMHRNTSINLISSVLRQSICYTVPEFEVKPLSEFCLSPEEMELIILLAVCYRKKNQLIRAKNLLKEVVNYARNRKIAPKLLTSYLPHAYLELSKVYEKREQYEDARYCAITGMKVLYCNAQLSYLVALQDQYIRLEKEAKRRPGSNMGKNRRRKLRQVTEERSVIMALYEECGLNPYRIYSVERYQECYVFHELLERYRRFWNMSKKEFCGDICSSQAFLKIETEGSCPNKTFTKWMERMDLPQAYYITQLHGGSSEHIRKKVRIDRYIRKNQYQKAEILFDQLEEEFEELQLISYCPENEQYFHRMRIVLKRGLQQPVGEDVKENLKKILYYTIPEYLDENLEDKLLFKQEVKVLNSLAIGYAKESEIQEAIKIWEFVIQNYYDTMLYGFVNYEESNIVSINYNSIISSVGAYKRSTELIYHTIKKLFEDGSLEGVSRCCYNIAWNGDRETIKEGKIEANDEIGIKFRQAKMIARMLREIFYIEFFKERNEKFS